MINLLEAVFIITHAPGTDYVIPDLLILVLTAASSALNVIAPLSVKNMFPDIAPY